MNVVLIFGPPAVGKWTVGCELAALTGYRLLHNNLTTDVTLELVDRSHPSFGPTNYRLRRILLEEALRLGLNLIETAAIDFASERQIEILRMRVDEVEAAGGAMYFVELSAPIEIRLERNRHSDRVAAKAKQAATLTDEVMRTLDERHKLSIDGHFPYSSNYLRLETTELSPDRAARAIEAQFSLKSQRTG